MMNDGSTENERVSLAPSLFFLCDLIVDFLHHSIHQVLIGLFANPLCGFHFSQACGLQADVRRARSKAMDVEPLSGLLTLFGGHCPDASGHNLAADVHCMIMIEGLMISGNDGDCCAKLRRNFVFAVDVFRSLFVP